MSNILIACHCKHKIPEDVGNPMGELHDALLYKELGKPVTAVPEDIDYIDINPRCPSDPRQYKDWSLVPENSKDYIYTINCTLYMLLNNYTIKRKKGSGEEATLLKNLIINGWKILRPGGSIIIPIDKSITVYPSLIVKKNAEAILHQSDNLEAAISDLSQNPWQVFARTSKELPFGLLSDKEYKEGRGFSTNFLIITKPKEGGSKKTRKNRNRKQNRY